MKTMLKYMRSKMHSDIAETLTTELSTGLSTETMPMRSLLSYNANEMLRAQGVAESTADYKFFHSVHRLLNIDSLAGSGCSLVRLGRKFDGGYVVAKNNDSGLLSENRIAYSLGINDDVSFDLMLAKLGYEVFQYDHTINELPVRNRKFHWRKLGITGGRETDELKKLETVLRMDDNAAQSGMLLKCDIEGFEWEMLDSCTKDTLERFDQIIIEFHGFLRFDRRDMILKVLKKISETHQAVHIHPNNNSSVGYSGLLVNPDVLEATFLLKKKYNTSETDPVLPLQLDQPCNANYADILLGKWNV